MIIATILNMYLFFYLYRVIAFLVYAVKKQS